MNRKFGFTVVEVAIVIFIISVLTTVTLVLAGSTQTSARDTKRQSDILLIKQALTRYYADQGEYPLPTGFSANTEYDANGGVLAPLVPNYLTAIPANPKGTSYKYIRDSTGGSYGYGLLVTRETDVTCRTGVNINPAWWGSGTVTCPY